MIDQQTTQITKTTKDIRNILIGFFFPITDKHRRNLVEGNIYSTIDISNSEISMYLKYVGTSRIAATLLFRIEYLIDKSNTSDIIDYDVFCNHIKNVSKLINIESGIEFDVSSGEIRGEYNV